VWLDAAMTSPYAFYQFWVNADDRDVAGYLKVFTFRSREEIAELEAAVVARPAARAAQRALASDVTTAVHGAAATARVVEASQALFGRGELAALDENTLRDALAELPRVTLPAGPHPVADLFAQTGLVQSRSAGRRTISEGGAYVNNGKVPGQDAVVDSAEALHGRWLLLRRGPRSLAAVELTR
jgi:tyrosyl-tRNA synthetase